MYIIGARIASTDRRAGHIQNLMVGLGIFEECSEWIANTAKRAPHERDKVRPSVTHSNRS